MNKTIVAMVVVLAASARTLAVVFACSQGNDVYRIVGGPRAGSATEAAEKANPGDGLLVMAEGYPDKPTALGQAFWARAKQKGLRVYVEFPADVPGLDVGTARGTEWEREIVTSDVFGQALKPMRIVMVQGCRFLPVKGQGSSWLDVGRVAGFDHAIYGLPREHWPILTELDGGKILLATTKLSGFVTGRYAPTREWGVIWERILKWADPGRDWRVDWDPGVRPAYGRTEKLPETYERAAFERFADWVYKSRLLVTNERWPAVQKALAAGGELAEPPPTESQGDGTYGIQEGYSSAVRWDGSQAQRLPLRADCNTTTAMVLALDSASRGQERSAAVARNLLDFVYLNSGMCGGDRADPKSPAFGLIGWGAIAPAWLVANYGDDNANDILATAVAGAALRDARWDEFILRALLANLRTAGKLGFRGDRIDMPALMASGWKSMHQAATVNYSPHFESWLWACYLWAYAHTGQAEFLDKARTAIGMTMAAYPNQWRWGDNLERAHMLLCLAWMVRVDDTPEHRAWLTRVARDLLASQQPCGAIQERLMGTGGGHYRVPQSNEAYGTAETPLLQTNADPVSDQLYTSGYALIGLHEAVGATGDAELQRAEDQLSEYLCRIQVKSPAVPYIDGAWFRAFDYGKWDYWASSADLGWGAWSAEAGWAQAWTAATLALRNQHTTMWDFTAASRVNDVLAKVNRQMAQNDGGPRVSPK